MLFRRRSWKCWPPRSDKILTPPKLGGVPARTAKREPDRAKPQKKSEQAGWFLCRYWDLREPPRPRFRSGTPPNLGGEFRGRYVAIESFPRAVHVGARCV